MNTTQNAYRLSQFVESIASDINRRIKELREFKLEHSATLGYHNSPGGVLNAYREGDLSFDEAVEKLNQLAGKETPTTVVNTPVCSCDGSGIDADWMPCPVHATQEQWNQFDAEVDAGIHQ